MTPSNKNKRGPSNDTPLTCAEHERLLSLYYGEVVNVWEVAFLLLLDFTCELERTLHAKERELAETSKADELGGHPHDDLPADRYAPYTAGASNAISVPFVMCALELIYRDDKKGLSKLIIDTYNDHLRNSDKDEMISLLSLYEELEKRPDELSPNKNDLESRLAREAANDEHF